MKWAFIRTRARALIGLWWCRSSDDDEYALNNTRRQRRHKKKPSPRACVRSHSNGHNVIMHLLCACVRASVREHRPNTEQQWPKRPCTVQSASRCGGWLIEQIMNTPANTHGRDTGHKKNNTRRCRWWALRCCCKTVCVPFVSIVERINLIRMCVNDACAENGYFVNSTYALGIFIWRDSHGIGILLAECTNSWQYIQKEDSILCAEVLFAKAWKYYWTTFLNINNNTNCFRVYSICA